MKFSSQIEINAPIVRVVDLFIDPEQMKKWLKELESFEPIHGPTRHIGSKSLLKLMVDEKKMEITETITVRNLPHQLCGEYVTKDVDYIAENRFEDLGNNITKYTVNLEFKFRGIMGFLGDTMKRSFIKKSQEQLIDFKMFIEKEIVNS
ncbi:MAG: SRPBCC family protein [Bacteroidota bacterium]